MVSFFPSPLSDTREAVMRACSRSTSSLRTWRNHPQRIALLRKGSFARCPIPSRLIRVSRSSEEREEASAAYGEEYSEEDDVPCNVPDSPPEGQGKSDLFKAIGVGAFVAVVVGATNSKWVAEHQDLSLILVFIIGYVGIILEEELAWNKSGVGLVMAVMLWTIRSFSGTESEIASELEGQLADVSQIIFFLLGAMTIVEIVDAHQGFKLVTDNIRTSSNKVLTWIIGGTTFLMSAVLDNLTSTIVMVSLLRKLVKDPAQRKMLGAVVVIAANAGGAWTPIGDVTTTMLWINGQITTFPTMRELLLPSLVSVIVPLAFMTSLSKDEEDKVEPPASCGDTEVAPRGQLVFFTGVASLLFVPIFKSLTGLPPYLGMLAGLGVLWLLTDAIHYGEEDRSMLKVPDALARIDTQGILFFLGILMSIGALDEAGLLKDLAVYLDQHIPSQEIIATVIGLVSAVIDNVPLVAATMGMYDISQYPQDDELWQFIAYCAGTGGSILIIGSAAGVAFMGMEKADFMWYLRKVTPWAFVGYIAGVGTLVVEKALINGSSVDALPSLANISLPF